MIDHVDPVLRNGIKGSTDSEHIFYYLLSLQIHHTDLTLREIVKLGLRQIIEWSQTASPGKPIGLNIIMTNGDILVGSRCGRTLWHLVREERTLCSECGKSHVHHKGGNDYRAIEVASEPITRENWQPFADNVVYSIDNDLHFEVEPLLKLQARKLPEV